MRMAVTVVCATLLAMAVAASVVLNYRLTWPMLRHYLAKRRYLRESVPHPEARTCDQCGGHATRLTTFLVSGKLVQVCRDRATCQKTQVYQGMLKSMT